MKIIFVRHGKDDDNYRGGWSDLDLTPGGKQQAELLAKYLKEHDREYRIQQIVSSDLPRAMSTAQLISDELALPVQPEIQLREMNNGDLAGMPNEEALERYPGLFFRTLKMNEPYPNGESPAGFFIRIRNWFDAFAEKVKNAEDNTLVVTHGGVINIVYHIVNGTEWTNTSRSYKTDHGGIHILNMDTMKFEVENFTGFLKT